VTSLSPTCLRTRVQRNRIPDRKPPRRVRRSRRQQIRMHPTVKLLGPTCLRTRVRHSRIPDRKPPRRVPRAKSHARHLRRPRFRRGLPTRVRRKISRDRMWSSPHRVPRRRRNISRVRPRRPRTIIPARSPAISSRRSRNTRARANRNNGPKSRFVGWVIFDRRADVSPARTGAPS
jgi:hypothetical protein